MSSLDEYQNLGKDLSGYVTEVRTNSGASGLQEAFKSGGKLFDVMQMLDQKEKAINSYANKLMQAFDPQNPGEITLDYVNKKVEENEAELAEIKLLKDRLGDLSSAVGQKTSGFAVTRAVNEFSEGVEKQEKVSKGFFSTFASFIGNIFKGKDEQKLAQASTSLETRTSAISNESQERFAIPGKEKGSPEIPQPEQVIQKGLSSQPLGGFTAPPIDLPPPLRSDYVGDIPKAPPTPPMSEVEGVIPKAPPTPPMSEVEGVIPKAPPTPPIKEVEGVIPKAPPTPPMSEVEGVIPKAPPTPPMSEVEGVIPKAPPTPPMTEVEGVIPKAPPTPPMTEVGSVIPKAPPTPSTPTPPIKEGLQTSSKQDLAPEKDLMSEIRERGGKQKKVSLNHPDYEYVSMKSKEIASEGIAEALKKQTAGDKGLPIEQRLLDGLSAKDQQNILYSAMYSAATIDKDKDGKRIAEAQGLVENLLKHQSDFNTGEKDDWELEVIEKRSTFSSEQVEAVRKAVEETRLRVAAGIDLPVKEVQKPITVEKVPEKILDTTVKVESLSQPSSPPISEMGGDIPPSPSLVKETVVKEPKTPTPRAIAVQDKGDLLAQIRGGGVKLKAVSQDQSLNSEEFTYTASKEKSSSVPSKGFGGIMAQAMQERRGDIEGSEELDEAMSKKLNKLTTKQQLNELYSAVIDGDKTKIARIVDVGNPEVFTKENMEKIANAAKEISATQEIAKKTIIESGVKSLVKEAEINISVGENRGK